MPESFRTKSKSSTSQQQHERQSDKPELENSSDHEGLVHSTEEIDKLLSGESNGNPINCKSSNRNRAGSGGGSGNISMLVVGWEDHRVVSTEYQRWAGGAEMEVVMKVTLLAAGFVLGPRGASAREIGQATGTLVQFRTETHCAHPTALPVRLFRIQGNFCAVEAAVYDIEEAVAKYRALCECKSRGEFVPREHVINGVKFFYQPPPKMALPRVKNGSNSLNFSRNHVWPMSQLHNPAFGCNCFGSFKRHDCFKPKDSDVCDRHLVSPDKNRVGSKIGSRYSWLGLLHCQGFKQQDQEEEMPKPMNTKPTKIYAEKVLSMEEKFGKLDMEDENEKLGNLDMHGENEKKKTSVDPWSVLVKEREEQEQMNCSPFSYFGPEGLPLPIFPFSSSSTNSLRGLFDCQGFKQQGQEEEMPKSMNSIHNKISAEKVLSMEEELGNLDMEDEDEKKKRSVDSRSVLVQEREEQDQMNCSFFSYFGPEGLPLPISSFDSRSAFDFSCCEFLGGRFPSFSFASAMNSKKLVNPEEEKLNSIDEGSECPPYLPYLLF
ncbi:hypothetical protein SUGI_0627360 [Cryptomeria japonica]|nr:hypothetical protein SUGI_0627360 [Cryptomeria japonica]